MPGGRQRISFSFSSEVRWEVAEHLSKHSGQFDMSPWTKNINPGAEVGGSPQPKIRSSHFFFFSIRYSEILYRKSGTVVVVLDECSGVFWPVDQCTKLNASSPKCEGKSLIIHPLGNMKVRLKCSVYLNKNLYSSSGLGNRETDIQPCHSCDYK